MSNDLIKVATDEVDYLKDGYFNNQRIIDLFDELRHVNTDNNTDVSLRIDVIIKILNALWGRHEKDKITAKMHDWKRIEQILYPSEKNYRDHLQHQLYVYLLGSIVIESIFDKAFNEVIKNLLDIPDTNKVKYRTHFVWMMASTFHDYAYPIQKFDTISNSISNFFWEEYRADIEIDSKLKLSVEHKMMFDELITNIKCIEDLAELTHFSDDFFKNGFLNRDHGIYSGMILIPKISKTIDPSIVTESDILLWKMASRTMALHNYRGQYPKIYVEKDPLLALLIICDEIQDWDRILYTDEEHNKIDKDFEILKLEQNKFGINLEMQNNNIEKIPKFIKDKGYIKNLIVPKECDNEFTFNILYKTRSDKFPIKIRFLCKPPNN